MQNASGITYLHGDHLGSTSVASNASGVLVSRQTYYAFGVPRTTEGTLPTDYTFTGQKYDSSDALLFYNARYYDSAIGRFTQPDTIVPNPGNPQTLNRYSYVNNNPLRFVDPTGHDFWESLNEFWIGVTHQWAHDNLPLSQARDAMGVQPNESTAVTIGRHVGNLVSIGQSIIEFDAGIAMITGGTAGGLATCAVTLGGGCAAGVAIDVAGVAVVVHGVAVGIGAAAEEGAMIGDAISKMTGQGKPSETHNHHLLPQQKLLKAKFEAAGLDIEDYTIELPADFHYGIHGKGGGEKWKNSWNKQWEKFFDENPFAGKDEILDQLDIMKEGFGIQ